MAIRRRPDLFSERDYDLIIIGGGIYGATLALESVFHGLRPLLLEKSDFGAATSFNSLRIVHGGLRYLQTLDLPRHFESVRERRWFLANFPDHVRPLSCMMPLYGKGVKRKSVFRAALLLNDALSMTRNEGVREDRQLPPGKVINRSAVVSAFPGVEQEGLEGAAVWFDAAVPDSQRVLIDILHWAASHGADLANYVLVSTIMTGSGDIEGVRARDALSGCEYSFRAPVVVNASGPWASALATQMDGQAHDWFRPSLAWNVVTDKPAPSEFALALTPPREGAPTYFVHPWKGRMFIGTGHSAWDGPLEDPQPSIEQLQNMIHDLNAAAPSLGLGMEDILHVTAGILPAAGSHAAKISKRPVTVRHSDSGGPKGLYSICGVKYTTARLVAERTLELILGGRGRRDAGAFPRPPAVTGWASRDENLSSDTDRAAYLDRLERIIEDEAAVSLQDLVFRRTDLWERPRLAKDIAAELAVLFKWSEDKKASELSGLAAQLRKPTE